MTFRPNSAAARRTARAAGLVAATCFALGTSAFSQEEPRQVTIEQAPIYNLTPPASALGVDLWMNRADSTYQIGEELTLFVRTSQDAAVTIVNVDALGRTTRLFPNKFATDNRLRANQVYQVPGQGVPFKFRIGGPAGVNLIKVIATTSSAPVLAGRSAKPDDAFETYEDSASDLARQVQGAMAQQPGSAWGMADRPIRVVKQHATVVPQVSQLVPAPTAGPIGATPVPAETVASPATAPVDTTPPFGLATIPSAFGLELRPGKASYRVGEELSLTVTPERNCKLTLLSVDSQNNTTVLYPNRMEKEPSLRGGRTAFLPGTDGKMKFTLLGGPGVQKVVAMCSEELSLLGSLFRSDDKDRAVFPSLGNESTATQLIGAQIQSGRKFGHATTTFMLMP